MIGSWLNGSDLRRQLGLYKKEFLWAAVFSMIANVLLLTPTLYMLQIFDHVMVSQNELTLFAVTLVMIFFFGVMAFSEWLRSRLLVRTGVRIDEGLNGMVFKASFDSYLQQARQKATEAFSNLVTIRQFLTGQGIIAFFDVPWTPLYIAVTFMLHPLLGWLSVLFAAIQLLVTYTANRASVSTIEGGVKAEQDSTSFVQSKLRNIEPLHAMGMVKHMRDRWQDHHESSLQRDDVMQEKQHRQQAFSKFVRYCMQSFTLGAGALLVIDGKLTPGAMIAANVLMARALQPLDLVIATWRQFVQARMAFRKLDELLDAFPERKGGSEDAPSSGAVRLEGLTAKVAGRDTPVLDNLNVDIPAGNVLVVLGPSGSGKSTLARCLVGVWPQFDGQVLLDGRPIAGWKRLALGPFLGYLPQDIELFEGTIADNIARFSEVDSEKVIDAAKRTGIHDMILRFPDGYDTEIGVAGGMLSGGQRQRIALARAIYGNPVLVVLDEPNANLDDAGERSLAQAVSELKARGTTVVLVTHRTSIVGLADYLLVLSKGRMVHFGHRDAVVAALRGGKVPSQISAPSP
ncbi:MAG: type I secretion system permease/ATPase [Chlorobium sp.]|jgi:ATP-binding cassette subfamily C exporter for protease/lipase|uniref:type I secretion system permease/ATPase n=1 Tax=Chlorobium sp. TaxID=1095 RepID=UPI0025B95439|nr:type I secretion system permease/ATPase [Chlorobium sp.]MCF8216985.1 type I secretion system permease/ATPase [Chlorobium sp.]MCF8271815.1 type I secretion system permease/ATPase [Chlorobium sp.]MCF8288202.1 type I secretion system permease/ATPase [Chlorobium sp.]MCF8291565.1 type I secretion system permease/ATPase [Chlorobium sp.]MCF8385885.1 type I secretion system permease/ATPase [Chlorobium sp.]